MRAANQLFTCCTESIFGLNWHHRARTAVAHAGAWAPMDDPATVPLSTEELALAMRKDQRRRLELRRLQVRQQENLRAAKMRLQYRAQQAHLQAAQRERTDVRWRN